MRVAVIGPESTGGRLVRRLLEAHPRLEVRHWSLPHGGGDERRWPFTEASEFEPNAVIVTTRDWKPMVDSKAANHVRDTGLAEQESRESYERLFAWLVGKRWRLVSYEALMWSTDCLESVFVWLGVPSIGSAEEVHDANLKWYAQ